MCIWSPVTGRHPPASRLLSTPHDQQLWPSKVALRNSSLIFNTFHIHSLSLLPFHCSWYLVLSSRSWIYSAVLCIMQPTEWLAEPGWLGLARPHFTLGASRLSVFVFFSCAGHEHQTSCVIPLGAAQSHGTASFSPEISKPSAPLCQVEFPGEPRRRI